MDDDPVESLDLFEITQEFEASPDYELPAPISVESSPLLRALDAEVNANPRMRPISQAEALSRIHRHDGSITLHTHTTRFRDAGNITVESLAERPIEGDDFYSDSYYLINGVKRGAGRNSESVAYLTCCRHDIDFLHDKDDEASAEERTKLVEQAERAIWTAIYKGLPIPSLTVRSGRGIWLFWLLRGEDDDRAIPATEANVAQWKRAQKGLARMLKEIAGVKADPRVSSDVARIARLPESINSNSGTAVEYRAIDLPDGTPRLYGLPALAAISAAKGDDASARAIPEGFDLASYKPIPFRRWDERRPNSPQAKALRLTMDKRFEGLELLIKMRGGRIKKGCRYYAVLLYHLFTLRSQLNDADHRRAVMDFNQKVCSPPLVWSEVRKALGGWVRIRNRTIREWLEVSDAEAEALANDGFFRDPKPRVKRTTASRRRLIAEMLAANPEASAATLLFSLINKGSRCSRRTVYEDLKVLPKTRISLINPLPFSERNMSTSAQGEIGSGSQCARGHGSCSA